MRRGKVSGAGKLVFMQEAAVPITQSDFMSEYVEARYARYVLRKAQIAEQELASQLVNDLFRDLTARQTLSDAGQQTLASIRLLAVSLSRPRPLHVHEWDAANSAADAWYQNAPY